MKLSYTAAILAIFAGLPAIYRPTGKDINIIKPPYCPNSNKGTYYKDSSRLPNIKFVQTSSERVKHSRVTIDSKDPLKKSQPACNLLCKNPYLDKTKIEIPYFHENSFKESYNLERVYKCHSYHAALANRLILEELELPLPQYPLEPQIFTIAHNQKYLLGSKIKDLTQDRWRSIQSSDEFNTLFKKFVEQNRLKLCMASALGVGDLQPQNIFYKKNKDDTIEFVIADYDTRAKTSMLPHYYADLTFDQKNQLTKFVQGDLYQDLLEKVFQITSYPEREKHIFLGSLKSYKKVVQRIEKITDKQKLKDTAINPHLPLQEVLFGDPRLDSKVDKFGFEPGFATTNSSSVICECK